MPFGKKIDQNEQALILAEAKVFGKSEAARRNNVSYKSIYNWFQALEKDSELSEKYQEKLGYIQYRWIDQLPKLIESASECIDRCLQEAPSDPKTLENATKVLELCSQMQFSIHSRKEELKQIGVKFEQ